jgi:hypothetical protein
MSADNIFFVDSTNHIVPCSIILKYSTNIKNELSMISNVREVKDDNEYVIFCPNSKPIYVTTENIDM